MWTKYDSSSDTADFGRGDGVVLEDEEYAGRARITLEYCSYILVPYVITCAIYGMMAHTAYAGGEAEGRKKYADMKRELQQGVDTWEGLDLSDWCDGFANKW